MLNSINHSINKSLLFVTNRHVRKDPSATQFESTQLQWLLAKSTWARPRPLNLRGQARTWSEGWPFAGEEGGSRAEGSPLCPWSEGLRVVRSKLGRYQARQSTKHTRQRARVPAKPEQRWDQMARQEAAGMSCMLNNKEQCSSYSIKHGALIL